MSENPESNARGYIEKEFISIIESAPDHDIGIAEIEVAMMQYRDALVEKHKGIDTGDRTDFLSAERALELLWLHYGSTAHVTGRAYLVDENDAGYFPREWGKPEKDEQGRAYYFLEEKHLISRGIEVNQERDDRGIVNDVNVRYLFAKESDRVVSSGVDEEDDDVDVPKLYVLPGELASHYYDTPTPEEAELRFWTRWPNEYELVKRLIHRGTHTPLTSRLVQVSAGVKGALASSEEFQTILEVYLDEQLLLSQSYPYVVTAQHEVLCYEGEGDPADTSDVDVNGSWTKVLLESPLTFVAHVPMIRFFENEQGEKRMYIVSQVYSEADGDDPEYVRLEVELTKQFTSTRAQRAILDRVLSTAVDDGSDGGYLKEAIGRELGAEGIKANLDSEKIPTKNVPEHIQQMERFSHELGRMQDYVTEAQEVRYKTVPEAMEACQRVLETVDNTLIGAGMERLYALSFSGAISVPVFNVQYDPEDNEAHVVSIRANKELGRLEHGDIIPGKIASSFIGVQKAEDEDEEHYYIVDPVFIVATGQENVPLVTQYGKDFADIRVASRVQVPISRDSQISVIQLESHKQAEASVEAAVHEYGQHPVVAALRSIRDEFATENEADLIEFANVQALHTLDYHASSLLRQGMRLNVLSGALESLFLARDIVSLDGDMFERKREGVSSKLRSAGDGYIRLSIVDIKYAGEGRGWRLLCSAANGEGVQIPLKSLKGLKF